MKQFIFLLFPFFCTSLLGQFSETFVVENIVVQGNSHTSADAIITLSGLKIGKQISIPSVEVQRAVKRLWKENIFNSIEVRKEIVEDKTILVIYLREYEFLGGLDFQGFKAVEIQKLKKNIALNKLRRYAPNSLQIIENEIYNFLENKGFVNATVKYNAKTDTFGKVNLTYQIVKGKRLKKGKYIFNGNNSFTTRKITKSIKKEQNTKGLFSWFNNNEEDVKKAVKQFYRQNGFINVSILDVKSIKNKKKNDYSVSIEEGEQFFLDSVIFKGNTVFTNQELTKIVKSLIGEKYNEEKLKKALYFKENRTDLTSLYLDHSYANFKFKFKPTYKTGNKVTVHIEIDEGKLYEFGKISFVGNVRTKDKILHHSVLTNTGLPFSRARIIRSQQKLMQLEYFVPEKFDVELSTDTTTKQVDVKYILKEKISDQFLVSGGFDGQYLIGTLGFDFKNFELSDVLKKGARWNPLPAGGGQHLSLKGQSDARNYYGFSFLFEEPRLNNKKMGFNFSSDYAYYKDDNNGTLKLFSTQIGISHFPKKSNPFLQLNHQINYRYYQPEAYPIFGFSTGSFNALTYKATLVEQTTNNSFYPTKGHFFKLQGTSTLPTSLVSNNLENRSNSQKYKWLEYYKIKAAFKHYQPLGKKNTLLAHFGAGYLGRFNPKLDVVPFERFEMGGTGITNYSINANDIIGLRGYEAGALSNIGGDAIATKMGVELRRKLLVYEKWMMTAHLFYENGNTWNSTDIIDLKHAFGIGTKLFIPMLGVVGVDAGWGINRSDYNWKQPTIQFTIGLDVGGF